jgi:GTP-binding protein
MSKPTTTSSGANKPKSEPRITVQEATFLMSARSVAELPAPTFAELVFAGKSNVGKSSLINSLTNRRKLARVSATPGCTRGINLFRIEAGDAVVHFVDLPGYGYAERSKSERKAWGPMIEGFLRERVGLSLVVVIVDVRRGITEEDAQLLEFLDSLKHPSVVVATKLDKLPPSKQKPSLAALTKEAGRKVIGFSSETGAGREELLLRLLRSALSRTSQ